MPKRNKPAARTQRSSHISAKSLDQPKTRSRPTREMKSLPEPDIATSDESFKNWPTARGHDPDAATLPVPDAPTLDQFLKEAGHVWRQAHWDTVMR